jgi:hypothetical protein
LKEAEVALYLDDDKALGRLVCALSACGYIPVTGGTEIAGRGQVGSYRRRYKDKKSDRQIHVQIIEARGGEAKYWVFAHTEPYAGKLVRHLVSAIFSQHDYQEGANLLVEDLGLPTS